MMMMMMMIRQAFPFFQGTTGIGGILSKIFTQFRPKSVIFPSLFLLGRIFLALTLLHGLTVSVPCFVSHITPRPTQHSGLFVINLRMQKHA